MEVELDGAVHQNTQEGDFEYIEEGSKFGLPSHCDYSERLENDVLGIQNTWY